MNEIFITEDGSHSLLSKKYGVSYHSKYGAIQESQHVFIEAALYPILEKQKEISVLGIGMGTGLNVFMTFLESQKRDLSIDYISYEKFPIGKEQIAQLNYSNALNAEKNQSVFEKIHYSEWAKKITLSPNFSFQKFQKDFAEIDFEYRFDVIFFDAFAPNSQPELWEVPLMKKMFSALKSGGVMTTYCAKGVVKRTLKSVGFTIEAIPGPPGKREMTRAWKRKEKS